jgi:dipeptidyl aminopeptidase/acylaminoacyl peptidase
MIKTSLLLLVAFALVGGIASAQETTMTIRPVTDMLGEGIDYRLAELSPDGSAIATADWGEQGVLEMCLYLFSEDSVTCYPVTEQFKAFPDGLHWSPDSKFIAFTEGQSLISFRDPDIWLFDRVMGIFSNLTDDGVEGSVISMVDAERRVILEDALLFDVQPVWNPLSGELYFFRYVIDEFNPEGIELMLYRVVPGDGEPKAVYDLTSYVGLFSVGEASANGESWLDGRAAISADGTKLAFIARDRSGKPAGEITDGVWVFDLKSGDPPTLVAPISLFLRGVPTWLAETG